jgi:hypothetical protein
VSKPETGFDPRPLSGRRYDLELALTPLSRRLEQRNTHPDLARGSRGKERVSHSTQRVRIHPAAIICDRDRERPAMTIFDRALLYDLETDLARARFLGILQEIEYVLG